MWKFSDDQVWWDDVCLGPENAIYTSRGESISGDWATPATLAPMPSGDIAFFTPKTPHPAHCTRCTWHLSFGIERKEVNNLLTSWRSGELADQMGRLVENYDWGALLIEGDLSAALKIWDIPWLTMEKVLLDYQDIGIRVLYSPDIPGTIELCQALRRKYCAGPANEPLRAMQRVRVPGTEAFTCEE